MTAAVLHDRISNIFVEHLHIQPPSPDTDLIEKGMIDSLSLVDLLAHLEQEFAIRIPLNEVDLNHFRSIARIGEFIRTQLPEAGVSIASYS
jgi:acyl carrier protein